MVFQPHCVELSENVRELVVSLGARVNEPLRGGLHPGTWADGKWFSYSHTHQPRSPGGQLVEHVEVALQSRPWLWRLRERRGYRQTDFGQPPRYSLCAATAGVLEPEAEAGDKFSATSFNSSAR